MAVPIVCANKHGSTQRIAECIAEQLQRLGKQAKARPVDAVEDPESYEAFSPEQRRKSKRTRQEKQNHILRLHDGRPLIRGRGRSRLSQCDANARQHSSPCETDPRSGDSCRGEAHLSRARVTPASIGANTFKSGS